ncbi:MAG: GNAT family N-acetyltransferase [Bacteroidales bacterium]
MSLQFLPVNNLNTQHFNDAIQIYLQSFPANEQQPINTIKQRVGEGREELYIGINNGIVVSMALLWHFSTINFTLLDYFAVTEESRGKQVGSQFFHFLSGIASCKGKHLVMEVESPTAESSSYDKVKRINFYLSNGAYILKDVPYTLPSLNGTHPTKMFLMVLPFNTSSVFSKQQVATLVTHLYIELYGKAINNLSLMELLQALPNQIELAVSI